MFEYVCTMYVYIHVCTHLHDVNVYICIKDPHLRLGTSAGIIPLYFEIGYEK